MRVLRNSYIAAVVAFLLLPAAIAIPASFSSGNELRFPPQGFSLKWYETVLKDPSWTAAIMTSFKVAIIATVLALALGFPAALALHQYRIPGKTVFWMLLMVPLVVPLVVVATGLFILALNLGVLGATWTVMLAHAVLALPIVVLIIVAALRGLDAELLDAAESLGASRRMVLQRVVLPAVAPSLVVAAILAFIVSWDEVVLASFLLTGSGDSTLPVKVFGYVRDAVNPTPAAISTMLLLVTAVALGLAFAVQRSIGALARVSSGAFVGDEQAS
jgi:ABC-type spermidine/putrescine transport system permease subunit II